MGEAKKVSDCSEKNIQNLIHLFKCFMSSNLLISFFSYFTAKKFLHLKNCHLAFKQRNFFSLMFCAKNLFIKYILKNIMSARQNT